MKGGKLFIWGGIEFCVKLLLFWFIFVGERIFDVVMFFVEEIWLLEWLLLFFIEGIFGFGNVVDFFFVLDFFCLIIFLINVCFFFDYLL